MGRNRADFPSDLTPVTIRVAAAANAMRGRAADAFWAGADGGRLATITSDAPCEQRGIAVSSIFVRPDGNQLCKLAQQFGHGHLEPGRRRLPSRRCRPDARPSNRRPRRRSQRHHTLTRSTLGTCQRDTAGMAAAACLLLRRSGDPASAPRPGRRAAAMAAIPQKEPRKMPGSDCQAS